MKKKTVIGYPISDLIGIVLMIIPFLISVFCKPEKKLFGILPYGNYSVEPEFDVALIACAFYLALVIRYHFFKKETIADIIVSVIRSFLDIWVLSSFLMFVIPQGKINRIAFWVVVLFVWLGMKSVAGYGWIIMVVMGVYNSTFNSGIYNAFGAYGALFVIFLTISLLLQISNVANIKDFMQEFKGNNNAPKMMPETNDGGNMNIDKKNSYVDNFSLHIPDLERVIDKEYSSHDIKRLSRDGIELVDCKIAFSESAKEFSNNSENGVRELNYVGSRNSITDPPYMRFEIDGKVLILTFGSKDELMQMNEVITKLGFATFDLS